MSISKSYCGNCGYYAPHLLKGRGICKRNSFEMVSYHHVCNCWEFEGLCKEATEEEIPIDDRWELLDL